MKNLIVVLGDQLDAKSAAWDGFDAGCDAVWMAEVSGESTHVWSHKARIALFLSAMRHFREDLKERGIPVHYRELESGDGRDTLGLALREAVDRWRPQRLITVEPGEWRVRRDLEEVARETGVPLEVRNDRHFLSTREEFEQHAAGRRQLRMEYFYREMRRRHGVLMDGAEPEGGRWNFDDENREAFGKGGPGEVPMPRGFAQDAVTRQVLELVNRRFPGHPGRLARFDWPVTPTEARAALEDFVRHRLDRFGRHQDAMWAGCRDGLPGFDGGSSAWLFHSRLSAAMNLKLLDPREVVAAVERAWREGRVPLASAEGFIRQVLGWREYVRGIYWRFMPGYADRNHLGADQPLPRFYWTGETGMNCLKEAIGQTLEYGYAHHIQRLMVTGLFALLLGVRPRAVHEWYLAVYVDAVEWVELPNTLGMSQFADGGLMASKPYVASGKYLQRMSNYCASCRFDPAQATGERACPFTTLYWDFLSRHRDALTRNPRMAMALRNLERLDAGRRAAIGRKADGIRGACAAGGDPS